MTVLIGTPAYGNMIHSGYLHTILDIERNGISVSVFTLGNESLITRARNSIFGYFNFYQESFSHLLFLDADIQLPAAGLKHMLELNKDVIGAPVPLKSRSSDGKPVFNIGLETQPCEEAPGLFTTNYIGTAALLLSKKVILELIQKAKDEERVYNNDSQYIGSQQWTNAPMYDVFRVGVMESKYVSEDFWVCSELIKMGHNIYVDSTVKVTHFGNYSFTPE